MAFDSIIEIKNGRTRLTVDPGTGSILRIDDSLTGLVHLDAQLDNRQDSRLFRLMTPADTWWSCFADSHVQPLVRCSEASDLLQLEYPDLEAADGTRTGVKACVEIRPSPRPDEFLLILHLENHGPRTILDTAFPLLGGWHGHNGLSSSRLTTANHAYRLDELVHVPDPAGEWGIGWFGANYGRHGQRRALGFPFSGLPCPWVDLSGPGGGLSYVNYMTECRNSRFWIENLAGYGVDFRLLVGWTYPIALLPGQSWTSPPVGLAVHGGDWHLTADRYTAWFDQIRPPDYSRPSVRTRIGFQNVFFRGFDGTPIRPVESIPQAALAGRRYGVDLLCVWDSLSLGNYARRDPRDLFDYPVHEQEIIQNGLRQAEADGSMTCALVNFRHLNTVQRQSDPDYASQVIRRFDGSCFTENWTVNHQFAELFAQHLGPESCVYSPFSGQYRARVLRLMRKYLNLGYRSLFYDQPIDDPPDYGRLLDGLSPDRTSQATIDLIHDVRQLLLACEPRAVIIGEHCNILATHCIDQWMDWGISTLSRPLIENEAITRYAIPHTILSWNVDREPGRASQAFALGMQLCIMVHGAEGTLEDEPGFGRHVAALAALRRTTADRTVMARFRSQQGLQLDGSQAFNAWVYESPDGPAVIVAAPELAASGRVRVDRTAFRFPGRTGKGSICRLDGSRLDAGSDVQEFRLEANETAVWLL